MITLKKTPNSLKLIPNADRMGDIQECKSIEEALESNLCNGWQTIDPNDIGALTSGTIISDDCEYDDNGNLINAGTVYWDNLYETRDSLEDLKKGHIVIWTARN